MKVTLFGSRSRNASPSTRFSVEAAAVPQVTVVNAPFAVFCRVMLALLRPVEVRPDERQRSAAVTAVVWYGTANQKLPICPAPAFGTEIDRLGLCDPTTMIEFTTGEALNGLRILIPRPATRFVALAAAVPQLTVVNVPAVA